jgi:hypothetical protein
VPSLFFLRIWKRNPHLVFIMMLVTAHILVEMIAPLRYYLRVRCRTHFELKPPQQLTNWLPCCDTLYVPRCANAFGAFKFAALVDLATVPEHGDDRAVRLRVAFTWAVVFKCRLCY